MKKNVPIETFIGAICNLEVEIVKSEGNHIVIKTWDEKYQEYGLTRNSRGEFYEYISNLNKLPE
jgi:hypothetical protein